MINHQIFEQLPGYIGWKDINGYHLGCNRNLAAVLHLKDSTEIIGLQDHELADHTIESSLFHKKNDQLVLKGDTIRGIHKSAAPYDGKLFYFVKKPLFNKANKMTGLIYYCHEFVASTALSSLFDINIKYGAEFVPSHYRIGSHDNVFNLSTRELECLFFILRGRSAKQIGEIMCLSKRTIESYIENIKSKFGCNTKSDLLLIAITNGYINHLPARFTQQSK